MATKNMTHTVINCFELLESKQKLDQIQVGQNTQNCNVQCLTTAF